MSRNDDCVLRIPIYGIVRVLSGFSVICMADVEFGVGLTFGGG